MDGSFGEKKDGAKAQFTIHALPKNVLVPIGSVAERSNTPTSKYVVITVSRNKGGTPENE